MKKIFVLFLALWCASVNAQQLRPYLAVGGKSVNFHGDPFDELDAASAFSVGVGCYVPVVKGVDFYVVPELSYSTFKYDNYGWIPYAETFRYSQLHLPVVADYRLKFTDMIALDLGAGPFVSYAIAGDAIEHDSFGRWNTGLALRANLRLYMVTLGFSYDLGMVDIQRYGKYDDQKTTLSMLGLNVGFCF